MVWSHRRQFLCAAFAVVTATSVMLLSVPDAFGGDTLYLKSGIIKTDVSTMSMDMTKPPSSRSYYLVQFKNRITGEDRVNLIGAHAIILRYMPDDALVVFARHDRLERLQAGSSSIQTILPYRPEWKMSAESGASSVFTETQEHKVLVRLFASENAAATLSKLRAIDDLQVVEAQDRSIVLTGPRPALDQVAQIDGVEWIQDYPEFSLAQVPIRDLIDPGVQSADSSTDGNGDYTDLTGYESGTKLMNFAGAWARGFTGRGQVASMADTGMDLGDSATIHPDFSGRVPTGFVFGVYAKSWEDPMGHGTHVAGSVVGNGAASGGILRGGAYEAQFVPEGMWSPITDNLTVPPKLADLFSKSYDAGARIHTDSWGSSANFGAYDGFAQQVDEFTASHPDMLILFAAGNSGIDSQKTGRIDASSIGSPSTAKNVLTVGASKNYVLKGGVQKHLSELKAGPTNWGAEPLSSSMLSDNPQGLAPFSSRGPTQDGRLKPEIVAPGTNILSVRSRHKDAETLWGAYSKDYVWSGGTSMATPLTAGAATVVRQYLVESRHLADPSAALIKAVLMHTATDLFPGQFGEIGASRGQELLTHRPNNDEGFGRVDVDKATSLDTAIIVDETKGLSTGETHTYPIQVSAPGKLTATLVYTDAAAAADAAKSLVNDLDLVLIDGGGKQVSLDDHTNNFEMLEMPVVSGRYQVLVKGTNVPQGIAGGKQPYALILSVH